MIKLPRVVQSDPETSTGLQVVIGNPSIVDWRTKGYYRSEDFEKTEIAKVGNRVNDIRQAVLSNALPNLPAAAAFVVLTGAPAIPSSFAPQVRISASQNKSGNIGRSVGSKLTSSSAQIVVRTTVSEDRDDFAVHRNSLNRLHDLQDDWDEDGAVKPNALVFSRADSALAILERLGLHPLHILPSVENGINIAFQEGYNYAEVEFANSGEMAFMIDNLTSTPKSWLIKNESNIGPALETIQGFLNGQWDRDSTTFAL